MRNNVQSKFQPLFGPETYTITGLGKGGAVVQNDDKVFRRHLDDIKPAPNGDSRLVEDDDSTLWFPKADQNQAAIEEEQEVEEADDQAPLPSARPQRNLRQPAYLQDYDTS